MEYFFAGLGVGILIAVYALTRFPPRRRAGRNPPPPSGVRPAPPTSPPPPRPRDTVLLELRVDPAQAEEFAQFLNDNRDKVAQTLEGLSRPEPANDDTFAGFRFVENADVPEGELWIRPPS